MTVKDAGDGDKGSMCLTEDDSCRRDFVSVSQRTGLVRFRLVRDRCEGTTVFWKRRVIERTCLFMAPAAYGHLSVITCLFMAPAAYGHLSVMTCLFMALAAYGHLSARTCLFIETRQQTCVKRT